MSQTMYGTVSIAGDDTTTTVVLSPGMDSELYSVTLEPADGTRLLGVANKLPGSFDITSFADETTEDVSVFFRCDVLPADAVENV